ncbi:chitin synthesis regulation, resistance to congo red-domain-containing protein [Xylariomycetidae sp. FL0641]|nr:chitin synthesis regulation, resistance to congo red-domain-containing protein [Xylariomycetidae sp. FL0641]
MAPFLDEASAQLVKRYIGSNDGCPSGYYRTGDYCRRSGWGGYGRWVFAAVVIAIVLAAFLWACINSRRRRRRGAQPMYGTGWMAGNPGQPQYYNNPQGYQPPPAYGAQGQTYPMNNYPQNPADGYYGQQSGVTAPKNVYNANNGATDYAPPAGPPPGK